MSKTKMYILICLVAVFNICSAIRWVSPDIVLVEKILWILGYFFLGIIIRKITDKYFRR